jgi:hypothetical protein
VANRYSFFALLFCLTVSVSAQPVTTGKPVPLLPDIDPQDIEIRGQYRPQFSGLRRQPVLGFNPQPPVFSQDMPRVPFFETPEQVAASTTISYLERPPQPQVTLRTPPQSTNGYVQAGFGNFVTPELRGIFDNGGEIRRWIHEINATGSDGHLSERESGFRFLDAKTEWIYRPFIDTDWRAGLQVSSNELNLFNPAFGTFPILELTRTLHTVRAHGAYLYNRGLYRKWNVKAALGFEKATLDFVETDESALTWQLSSGGTAAGAKTERWWDWGIQTNGISATQNLHPWAHGSAQGAFQARYADWRWKAGLKVVGGTDSLRRWAYVFPEIDVRFQQYEWLDLRIHGTGGIENLTPSQALASSWYLRSFETVGNEYFYTAAAALSIRPARLFTLHAALKGTHYYHYRLFSIDPQLVNVTSEINDFRFSMLKDVTLVRPSAGVRIWLEDSGLSWYNELYWISVRNEPSLPFIEDFGFLSDLSWQFMQQWFGQLTLRYISDRQSPSGSGVIDGYMLLDARVEYKFNKNYGVYVSGMNLLNENYQVVTAYRERPLQVLGGITVRF